MKHCPDEQDCSFETTRPLRFSSANSGDGGERRRMKRRGGFKMLSVAASWHDCAFMTRDYVNVSFAFTVAYLATHTFHNNQSGTIQQSVSLACVANILSDLKKITHPPISVADEVLKMCSF